MLQISRRRKAQGSWDSYRYGSAVKPTLPPLFKGKRRESAISETIGWLETFRFSKFEREGDCRNGIRATLCLRGHSWGAADATAADVVREGLRRIGAERPSWYQGQPDYAEGRERCLRCAKFVDESDQAAGRRFCSQECARVYRVLLAYEPPPVRPDNRDCAACGKTFRVKTYSPNQKYCSRTCAGTGEPLQPRPCEWCGNEFQPTRGMLRYCSRDCASFANIQKFRDANPERSCIICKVTFRPKQARQEVCSYSCRVRRDKIRDNARKRAASGFYCEAAE
jgi:endogenous inhibitor of DNA gyrase (YacG/DUF329 family)